ncbi:18156_t:CDS:2, partial [Racocetra persica]
KVIKRPPKPKYFPTNGKDKNNRLNLTLQQDELTSPINGITENSTPMSGFGNRRSVDKNKLRKEHEA